VRVSRVEPPSPRRRIPRHYAVVSVVTGILLFSLITIGACGGSTESSTSTSGSTSSSSGSQNGVIKKIGIVTPEKANDFGWNQQGVESARKLAQELGAEIEVVDGAGYGDVAPIYRQLVADGVDWVILWASGYNTVGPQLAQETGTKTAVIGAFEKGLVPGLCADWETNAQEGAYLAGVAGALMSDSGVLGIVPSADDENWNKMAGGFIVGARATRPDITIRLAQVGQAAYADVAAAKRVTESVIAAGADVIFGMGDGASFGMIQAVENASSSSGPKKVWFIDVIGDKSSIDDKGVILTSVVWDYLPVLRMAAEEIATGIYGETVSYLGLGNGGMKLLKRDLITAEVWAEVEAARLRIEDGSVQVPVAITKADVDALLE